MSKQIPNESPEEWADRVLKEDKELNTKPMKSIDEIIDQYTPYSKSIPTWDREDITQMLKEYATQIVDEITENISYYTDNSYAVSVYIWMRRE